MTDDAYRAHVFLREIRSLNILLAINELEQEDMFNKAQGCGSFSTGLKVQTSPKGDAMELAIAKLVELENEHERILGEIFAKMEYTDEMFEGLTMDESSILRLYYFQRCTDEKISDIIHLSRQRVNQLRHVALEKMGRRMKD